MDEHLGPHGAGRIDDAIARCGIEHVRRARRAGRWTSPWPGVLVEARRASEPLTLAAAAVALAGSDALLAGPTAAHLHGLTVLPPTPVHLLVPYGHRLRSRGGLRVHNGPVPDEDRAVRADLPVLGLPRTVTDLVCTARPPDAVAVLDEVLAGVDPAERDAFRATVAARLRARRDPRGTVRGLHLVELATGRAASPAESRLLWRVVDAGFPIPEVNWPVTDLDGRELYQLDLAWPTHRIVVEYQGYAAHVDRAAADEARAEDLRRRGWIVVLVCADDASAVVGAGAALDAAFRRRGVDTSRRQSGVLSGRRHREQRAS